MHWWRASKQQSGRGGITLTRLPNLPIYDLRMLPDTALDMAAQRLDDLKTARLLPLDQIDRDKERQKIDAAMGPIFGLPDRLLAAGGAVDLLRRKLAHEPSITGGR